MGKIARLSTELTNQIAAGEVVERPASAVKELIENALDAGARRVAVTVELGGKRLIRVEDDGEGMTADDVALALERHATSKLRQLDDLTAISTLGFRGEALPSIASVSRLTIRSRARGASHGTEVRVEAGTIRDCRAVGMPEGTVVEVADLFHNVPARRKFLKSDRAEAAQISRLVTQLSLGFPEVGFRLTSRDRQVLQCPPVQDLKTRFFQLYGDRPDLVEVDRDAAGVRVFGYVAALAESGPARGPQNIFVNRRAIKDRTVAHAVHEAYSQATVKPRQPEVHLFLEVPADRVDVNVHPMKAEVRFLEQSLIHELLRRALQEALGQPAAAPLAIPRSDQSREPVASSIPGVHFGATAPSRWSNLAEVFGRDQTRPTGAEAVSATVRETPPTPSAESATEPAAPFPLMPLGQFRDTFIIAVDHEGVAIVDQHVAHERILYEQVMERLSAGPLEGQRLLEPMVVEMAPGQRDVLAAHAAALSRLGFEVEPFGGAAVRVTTVPGLLDRLAAERAVRALALDLDQLESGAEVTTVLRQLAATTACHAAVKANDHLSPEKMRYILAQLRQTAYSTVCPHGRPVVLRLSRQEIERQFGRT